MSKRGKFSRVFTLLASTIGALALTFATAPVASATIVGPTEPISIGGATGSTISGVTINGQSTTFAQALPGATINMQATLTLGAGATYDWYGVGYGWSGDPYATGCGLASIYGSPSDTTSFALTAPTTAGVYNVVAALGPDWCPFGGGVTIAKIAVVSYDSLCALTQSYSSSPSVAAGLCDKLAAAKSADARGQTTVKSNVLGAFDNQLRAQTGKAFTTAQATMLMDLVALL